MSDNKEPKIDPRIPELEAELDLLRGMLDTVDKKARSFPEVGDALFSVIRRFRIYKRNGK